MPALYHQIDRAADKHMRALRAEAIEQMPARRCSEILEGLPSSGSSEIDAVLSAMIDNGRAFMHAACESIEADLERSGYYAALDRAEASAKVER
jgi:hypothetical protein